jgi:hypothetical protein
MAGRERLDILIKTLFDRKGAKDAKGALDDLGKSAEKSGSDFDRMKASWKEGMAVIGGVATALAATKIVIDEFQRGIELDAASQQFTNLTASIGTTSSALLNEMKAATSGLKSDADLISSANELISLGLAKTSDEVVRLANVAGRLNLDMQVLGLTLANDSTARLDSLGLSIEDVKNKAEALQASGFTGDSFDAAVIEALEERVVLLGDATETTAGQAQQVLTVFENIHDAFSLGYVDEMAESFDGLTASLAENNDATIEAAGFWGAFFGAMSGELISSAVENTNQLVEALQRLAPAEKGMSDSAIGLQNDLILLDELSADWGVSLDALQAAMDASGMTAGELSTAFNEVGTEALKLNQSIGDTDLQTKKLDHSLIQAAIATGILTDGVYRSDGGFSAMEKALQAAGVDTELFTQEVVEAAQEVVNFRGELFLLGQEFGSGNIYYSEAMEYMESTSALMQELTGDAEDLGSGFSGAARSVRTLGDAFASSAQSGITSTLKSLFDEDLSADEMLQRLTDSITDAKVDTALTDLGQQVAEGLISEEEAIAQLQKIKNAVETGEGIFNTSVGVKEAQEFFGAFSGNLNSAILDYVPPTIQIPYEYVPTGAIPEGLPSNPGGETTGGTIPTENGAGGATGTTVTVNVHPDQWAAAMIQWGGV